MNRQALSLFIFLAFVLLYMKCEDFSPNCFQEIDEVGEEPKPINGATVVLIFIILSIPALILGMCLLCFAFCPCVRSVCLSPFQIVFRVCLSKKMRSKLSVLAKAKEINEEVFWCCGYIFSAADQEGNEKEGEEEKVTEEDDGEFNIVQFDEEENSEKDEDEEKREKEREDILLKRTISACLTIALICFALFYFTYQLLDVCDELGEGYLISGPSPYILNEKEHQDLQSPVSDISLRFAVNGYQKVESYCMKRPYHSNMIPEFKDPVWELDVECESEYFGQMFIKSGEIDLREYDKDHCYINIKIMKNEPSLSLLEEAYLFCMEFLFKMAFIPYYDYYTYLVDSISCDEALEKPPFPEETFVTLREGFTMKHKSLLSVVGGILMGLIELCVSIGAVLALRKPVFILLEMLNTFGCGFSFFVLLFELLFTALMGFLSVIFLIGQIRLEHTMGNSAEYSQRSIEQVEDSVQKEFEWLQDFEPSVIPNIPLILWLSVISIYVVVKNLFPAQILNFDCCRKRNWKHPESFFIFEVFLCLKKKVKRSIIATFFEFVGYLLWFVPCLVIVVPQLLWIVLCFLMVPFLTDYWERPPVELYVFNYVLTSIDFGLVLLFYLYVIIFLCLCSYCERFSVDVSACMHIPFCRRLRRFRNSIDVSKNSSNMSSEEIEDSSFSTFHRRIVQSVERRVEEKKSKEAEESSSINNIRANERKPLLNSSIQSSDEDEADTIGGIEAITEI